MMDDGMMEFWNYGIKDTHYFYVRHQLLNEVQRQFQFDFIFKKKDTAPRKMTAAPEPMDVTPPTRISPLSGAGRRAAYGSVRLH